MKIQSLGIKTSENKNEDGKIVIYERKRFLRQRKRYSRLKEEEKESKKK